MLGKLYLTGQGVTHDQTRAMAWFSRSAAQGEPVRPALFGATKRPPSALHYVGGHPPALPHEPAL
nr:SEL1-like repeat protein [Clostridium phoceensis]